MDNKEINQEVKDEVKTESNAEIKSSNNSKLNKILIICIGILIVAIVGVVSFFILKKDNPNNASKNVLLEETNSNIESEAEKLILSVCVHSLVEGFDNAQELSKEQLLSGLYHYLYTTNYLSYGDNQYNDGWYKISREEIEYYIKDIFNIEYKNHSKTTDEDLLKYENGVYYYHDLGGDFYRDPVVLEIKEIKKINDKTYNVSFEYEWGYGIEEVMPDGTWKSRIEKPDVKGTAVIKLDGNNYYLSSFSQEYINEI